MYLRMKPEGEGVVFNWFSLKAGRMQKKQRILEKMIGSTAIKGFETGNGFLVSRLETRGTTSKERRSSLSRLVF